MKLLKKWVEFWNRQVKKFNIFDVKLAQGCAMFFALILAKLIPQIMELSIWWFVGLAVICSIRPWYVICAKRNGQPADAGEGLNRA